VALRRHWAPHLRERPALAYWVNAALLALVFIWGPIPATRDLWEMLLFTILAFVGTHVLRAQIAAEFPDTQPITWRASLGETVRSMGTRIGHGWGESHEGGGSTVVQLERLAALHDRGAITDEEYAAAKRKLLAAP
jgi:Short C-terminal domain